MESREIVRLLAASAIVETICQNIGGNDTDLQDLAQDIYLDLLRKDADLMNELWDSRSYNFYITKMVINNVFSKTSPYYEQYKRFKKQNDEGYIQDNREILPDE